MDTEGNREFAEVGLTDEGSSNRRFSSALRSAPVELSARKLGGDVVWSAVTCHRLCTGDLSPSKFRARSNSRARQRWRES